MIYICFPVIIIIIVVVGLQPELSKHTDKLIYSLFRQFIINYGR